jgi:DNA-binding response OmpR family regulator
MDPISDTICLQKPFVGAVLLEAVRVQLRRRHFDTEYVGIQWQTLLVCYPRHAFSGELFDLNDLHEPTPTHSAGSAARLTLTHHI